MVERTNNVAEHFFGQQKQCRRLGRAQVGRDLEDQPAHAALVANLTRADYVRVLCGSLENLPAAFAALGYSALEQTTPLSRPTETRRCSPGSALSSDRKATFQSLFVRALQAPTTGHRQSFRDAVARSRLQMSRNCQGRNQ